MGLNVYEYPGKTESGPKGVITQFSHKGTVERRLFDFVGSTFSILTMTRVD